MIRNIEVGKRMFPEKAMAPLFYPIASRKNMQTYNSFKGGTHWWGLLSRHPERVLGALLVVTV